MIWSSNNSWVVALITWKNAYIYCIMGYGVLCTTKIELFTVLVRLKFSRLYLNLNAIKLKSQGLNTQSKQISKRLSRDPGSVIKCQCTAERFLPGSSCWAPVSRGGCHAGQQPLSHLPLIILATYSGKSQERTERTHTVVSWHLGRWFNLLLKFRLLKRTYIVLTKTIFKKEKVHGCLTIK